MTTREPLWNDEHIIRATMGINPDMDRMIRLRKWIKAMRDEYEAERAAHLARIADLRRAVGDVQTLLAQLDSLEAELAEARQ